MPYSKRACLNASKVLNLQIGNHEKGFIGDYLTKGCHANEGFAFYGTGGDLIWHKTTLIKPNYRPNGYDCGNSTNNN